jgi:hypothetical protein
VELAILLTIRFVRIAQALLVALALAPHIALLALLTLTLAAHIALFAFTLGIAWVLATLVLSFCITIVCHVTFLVG